MSSRRGKLKKGEDKTDINISPMIDMVFILLIFFIVTTVFVDEQGVAVDKPTPSPQVMDSEDKPMLLKLTENGEVLYMEKNISLSGVRNNVSQRMQEAKVPVIIEVEPEVRSGFMVRVMDEARVGGAEKISIQQAVQ